MIIDFRLRPPARGFLDMILFQNKERTGRIARSLGLEPAPSFLKDSMPLLLREMDQAGISLGVIAGRRFSTTLGSIPNEDIAAIVAEYPQRFVAYAGVDPSDTAKALEEIDRWVKEGGFKGIVLEPGLAATPMYCDDRRLSPLYARCAELGVPVLLMAGGNAGPDLTYSSPVALDHVAAEFPTLPLIAAHGCWPWVTQALHVAFRRLNVYISPDMYLVNCPGWRDYVDAANSYLQDRFLFATAYPFLPLSETVAHFKKLPFRREVLPKLLYGNAARLLGLAEARVARPRPAGGKRAAQKRKG